MPEPDRAWITAAWDDKTSLRAIVLGKSLRKVVTHGTLVVLTTQNISDGIRELLVDTFDVLLQEVDLKSFSQSGLSVLDWAKISSWKLYWWKKCIFLEPHNIVLQNCDELFDNNSELFSAPAAINNGDCAFGSSIFAFQPSYSVYKQLHNLAVKQSFENVSFLFKLYFQTWTPMSPQYFDISSMNSSDLRIASLSNIRPWENIEINGMENREKLETGRVEKKWLEFFFNDVMKNLSPQQATAANLDLHKIKTLKEKFGKLSDINTSSKEIHNYLQDSIAIIGYSCKFPGANNKTEFWELLKAGGDAITQMPIERLTESQLEDPKLTSVKAGFLKCPIDEFDAKFFGISPREAVFMDPQQRLLTEVAWEALENAGLNPHSLKGSNTGVFTGVWTHEYESLLTKNTMGADFHHVVLGNAYSATSARVSYVLGLNGPNIVTESGCSSSMVSLHLACQSLRRNDSNLTLVGGVNLLCAQFPHSEVSILAKDGHCKTFDEKADGFARGEGVGVLVLKRYSDAVRDGDRVMAIIRGTGISNEGTTNSFGTPSKFCQEIAIKEAIKDSGVNPLLVDYVEAHGTGTPIGDPIEFSAIAAGYSGEREKPLIVGSVKTNIGHSESAAGMAGLIKVMLAMDNDLIPMHRNLETLNPSINLESVPAVIPTSPLDWPRVKNSPRLAGVSSFGISGTNVHVIVQEPPHLEQKLIQRSIDMAREHEVLTLSAKSEESVKELSQKYISYFDANPNVNLKDLVFTANNGRAHFRHRIAVVGKNVSEMKLNLQKELYISGQANINAKPVIAFLFTGQGSQYIGMAKSLYESSEIFKETLDLCAKHLKNNCTTSLFDILWNDNLEGCARIDQTLFSQIAIFCVEYALLKLWESFGVKPDYVLGHSVGEFAAAVAAGALDLKDAIILVTERSRLIHNLPQGRMLAVRSSPGIVTDRLSEFHRMTNPNYRLDIAVINSNEEVVLAGSEESILAFIEFCKSKSINMKTQYLAASHAFHSRDMDPIMEPFAKIANTIKYKAPKCNYISGSTGKLLQKEDFSSEYWQKHARNCVDFASSVKSLELHGCNTFIEIGAHPILLALTMNNLVPSPEKQYLWLPSIRKTEDQWVTIMNSLAKLYVSGFNINWEKVQSSIGRKKLELPTYAFQRQRFWVEQNVMKNEIALGGKILHPLLGSKIPLAGKDNVYQHDLDLKTLSYLEDHQVANITILPGAGYLEMIVAASLDVFKGTGKESDSLFVSQFLIEAPLELDSNRLCRVQTVAMPSELADTLEVKIYQYCNLNGYSDEKGWKLYASAKVSKTSFSEEPLEEGKIHVGKSRNTSIDIEMIKSQCELETTTEEYYKKTPEIGIFFGKTFQSVSKIWKGKNEALALIPVPENAGKMQDYIYHPIVLDAMIQAFGIVIADRNEEKKDLFLPVGIDKFEMVKTNTTSSMYAHVTWTEDQATGNIVLYNENSEILCAMNNIRFVSTTMTSFLNVINAHNNKLPGMYTEIWRGRDGPLQSRVDYSKLCFHKDSKLEVIKDEYNFLNSAFVSNIDRIKAFDEISYLEILKSFLEMGWKPMPGEIFSAKQLMSNLIISPSHEMLLERFLQIFCEESILECHFDADENCLLYKVIKQPTSSLEELEVMLQKLYHDKLSDGVEDADKSTKLIKHCQSNLAGILLGKKSAVSALFGGEVDPFQLYSVGTAQKRGNESLSKFISNFYETISQSDSIIRILEVGAGSGATTSSVLSLLKKRSIPFRYTFTDISQQFLEDAKKKFKDYSGVEYKILNLETDPKEQGFSPFHYDVIIASNVIHTVVNIRHTVQYLRHLMVPSGILCVMEMFKPCRIVDMMFGVFEGYWRFKDFDLRTSHCTLSRQKWELLLSESQFTNFECPHTDLEIAVFFCQASEQFYSSEITAFKEKRIKDKQPCFIIFDDNSDASKILQGKLQSVGCSIVSIFNKTKQMPSKKSKYAFNVDPTNEMEINDILSKIVQEFSIHTIVHFWSVTDSRDQEYICHGLLHLLKFLCIQTTEIPKVMVVTRGNNFIGDQGEVYPACATSDGLLTSFRNECVDKKSIIIDLDPDRVDSAVESQELFHEIWNNSSDQEKHIAFRNKRKYISRLTNLEKPSPPLRIPTQQRYCLMIPNTKSINDVTYRSVDKAVLSPTEVEIAVKATALNFRDIFVILKPDMFKSLFESVGTDFSGIISDVGSQVTKFKIGDEVFGISNNTSVASHVVVPHDLVMLKPKEFTFADAATLPSVFLTAYFCLVKVGQLKTGETILIHVASGGVGLVAIQLAKQIGANIIATAGSKRKRAYLRSIGIQHVFHSRDISYGDEIERVTNGKGVDMVLNSITGPNFKETSLRVCAPNARFVEMGKVNIWQPEDVSPLRPDVQYTIVDLEKAETKEMEILMHEMEKFFERGNIEPLPYTRFEGSQIKEALNYFLKAQHIGKIVVAMPECCVSRGKQSPTDILFNSGSTYLITGGLGGIGLEVAKWMAKSGARNLVLVARSKPNEKAIEIISHLNSKGCKTLAYQVDVGNFDECKNLFRTVHDRKLNLPPLRGIIHSAGSLADDFLKNQTWEKYEKVFNAKVKGGWNLHDLTKDMRLEFFVLFSSFAGPVGPPAQSNHSSANCFLAALARHRYSIGLPAQAIDWGAWSEIGAATNTAYGKEGMFGVKPFTPNQGISSLKYIMNRPFNRVAVVQCDFSVISEYMAANKKYTEELEDENAIVSASQVAAETDAFWLDIKDMEVEDRSAYIVKYLENIIRKTLKLPDSEQIDEHQSFSEMGLDSLMAIEMRNKLQVIFGKHITLNPTSLMDYPTMASLSTYLAELTFNVDIESIESFKNEAPVQHLGIDGLKNLIMKDSILPDHIKDIGGCVSPSNIRTILLTGGTGHLGVNLLKEISLLKNMNIICLIRAKTVEIARKRLISSLKKFELLSHVDIKRIDIILGNVAEKQLGLNDEIYGQLSTKVDAIIHCAVKANHIERYQNQNSISKSDVRSVNTIGTLHILELASNQRTKRVIYPGSFSSANELTDDGYLSENIPSLENTGDGVNIGYGVSKLVAEKLIGQAIQRGIPCTVLRLPSLIGHSGTGHFTLDTNTFMRIILTLCQLEMAPCHVNTMWYSIPINIACTVICQLIFNDQVETGLYNLIQPEVLTMEEFVELAKTMGWNITMIPPAEFEKKVRSNDNLGSSLISSFISEDQSLIEVMTNSCPALKMGLEHGKSVYLKSSKIEKLVPNFYDLIPKPAVTFSRHISYAKTTGSLESFIKL